MAAPPPFSIAPTRTPFWRAPTQRASRAPGVRAVALLGVLSALVITPASASAADSCSADVARLCPAAESDVQARSRCLQQHTKELSSACLTQMAVMGRAVEQMRKSCGEDTRRLCAGVQPGEGRIAACLHAHEAQLSATCRTGLRQAEALRDRVRDPETIRKLTACSAEVPKYCAQVKLDGGDLLACLAAHTAELGADCRAQLAAKPPAPAAAPAAGGTSTPAAGGKPAAAPTK